MRIFTTKLWIWVFGLAFWINHAGIAALTLEQKTDPLTSAVLGEWTKSTGLLIILKSDGSFSGKRGAAKGAWKCLNPADRKFEIAAGPDKETLTLSADGEHLQGVDQAGKPITYVKGDHRDTIAKGPQPAPEPVEAAPAPITPEIEQLAKDAASSLVFIESKTDSGIGFVADLGGSRQIVTNTHVLVRAAGGTFTVLPDGSPLALGERALAVDGDAVRTAVAADTKALTCMKDVEKNAAIGDDIVVLGRIEGQRTVQPIRGRIVSFGTSGVEVDARFPPGSSGGPVIHLRTGQVIGIATYDVSRLFSGGPGGGDWGAVHRFATRLDTIRKWQPIPEEKFLAESAQSEQIEQLTNDLVKLWEELAKSGKITLEKHQNSVLQKPIADYLEATTGPDPSKETIEAAQKDFRSSLRKIVQEDITAARSKTAHDYFQRALARETRSRQELYQAFEKVIKK